MNAPIDADNLQQQSDQEIREFVGYVKNFFKDHLGLSTTIFVSIGFLYTLIYTTKRDIPFPLDAAVTLYILMAFLALFITCICFISLILPMAISSIKYYETYKVLYGGANFLTKDSILSFIRSFGYPLTYLATGICLCLWLETTEVVEASMFWVGLVFSYVASLIFIFSRSPKLKSIGVKVRRAALIVFLNMLLQVWFFWLIALVFIPFRDSYTSPSTKFLLTLISFSLVLFAYLGIGPVPENQKRRASLKEIALTIFFIIGIVPLFINPVADFVANAVLRMAHLGGNTPVHFYFNKDSNGNVPSDLVDDENPLRSKELLLMLNVGGKIFVSVKKDLPKRIFEVDPSAISSIVYH